MRGLTTGGCFGAGKEGEGCEQEFFPAGHVKSNFLCNLGHGDPSKLFPRSPRLEFNEACHGKLGISSAWGGGPDLVALIGPSRALRMTARCELVPAPLALQWGLVDEIADGDQLERALSNFIAPILRQSPATLRAGKDQALAWRRGDSFEQRRALEQSHFVSTWTSPDHWSAVDRLLQPKVSTP